MTPNRRKRGFNDGTEDRSVAPYFQWKLKYGAIASSPQAPYPLLPRGARKQAHSAAAPLQIKAKALIWFFYVQRAKRKPASLGFPFEYSHLSRSALPRLVDARGVRRARPKEFFHRTCRRKNNMIYLLRKLCEASASLPSPSGGRGTALARWMRAVNLRTLICYARRPALAACSVL